MQVVILHKEIGLKIAETVHCAKCRSPRAAGSRRRAAHKKDPRLSGAEAVHAVCDEPSQLDFGVILHHVIQVGLVAGDDAPDSALPSNLGLLHSYQLIVILFEHCCVPLSFICLYYSTLLEVCQVLFLVSGELFHQIPDDVILTIGVVFIRPTVDDAFLLHLIQNVDDAEAVDSQIHRNLTQAETIGMVGKQFSNLFFHCCFLPCFCTFIIADERAFVKPYFKFFQF